MNLELVALIEEGICLRFVHPGPDLPKGEVAWARIIQSALRGSPPEFVEIESLTFEDVIARELERDNTSLWALEETGTPLLNRTQICYSAQNSFIIGNHHGFDSEALKVFDDHSIYRVSLGRISYLTSHCVVAILSHLEEMIN